MNGSATGADYTPTTGTLTIPATSGETYVGSISVPVEDDNFAENAEAFTLNLSLVNPPDDVLLERTTARATIAIDAGDRLTAKVEHAAVSVDEGKDAVFNVELTGGISTADVVIRYDVTGDAEKNVDYEAPSGSLRLPAGTSLGSIVIPTTDDDVFEITDDETIVVTLQDTTSTTAGAVVVSTQTGENPATIKLAETSQNVTVSVADRTVTEGERALFPVTLSGKVFDDVTVNYTVTDVTTTGTGDDADYTSAATSITIAVGETTGTITVATAEETVAEDDETFTVTLTSATAPATPTPLSISLGQPVATGTIVDDDPLTVTLEGPDQVPEEVDATGYKVRLIGGTGSAIITVEYTVDGVEQTAVPIAADDGLDNTVDIEADLPNIPTAADSEGDTIVVRLTDVSTDSGTVNLGSPREKRTRIVDGDTKTVSISGGGAVNEGANAEFPVSVTTNGASRQGAVTVHYQMVPGSASSADYEAPSGTLELDAGTASDTITVSVLNDDLAERAETFSVRLNSVTRANSADKVVLGNRTATATIGASNELTPTVTSPDTTVVEGESARFVVDLGGTSSESVVIDYTVTGTDITADTADEEAEAADYAPQSGQLRISRGQRTGTIVIRTVDDDVLEPRESFKVTLESVAPSDVFAALPDPKPSADSTIEFSDRTVRVSVADVTADEGEAAVFTVSLDGEVGADVTVTPVIAHGTEDGTENEDFEGDAIPTFPSGVTILKGETTATFTVETMGDMLAENTETFTVTLTALTMPADWPSTIEGGPDGIELGRAVAKGTITDDAVTVNLRGATTVNEGDAVEYTVSLSGYTDDEDIIVTFSVESDTATSQDYSPASGTLTLNSEESSGTFTIQITDEPDVVDLRESLVVSIVAETSDGDPVRTEGPITTTIEDDGTVGISVEADPEIVPESREEATFTVTLTGTVGDEPVVLDYGTADGTATAPADYTAANGTITIAAGDSSAIITVAVNDDGLEELTDETFDLTISAAALPDGVEIETDTATVTVTDHTLEASVSAPATVNEGQSVAFTVSLTPAGQNRSGLAVNYDLGGTAVAPGDYTGASSGTLTIPAGQDSGAITIATEDDRVLDPGETLSVTLSNPRTLDGGLAALGSPTTATVEIVDQQTVTWSVEDVAIDENQDAVFTVTLDGLVQDAVTLTYATADGTATAGSDYTAVSNGRVTVAGGSTSATFTVQVTDDSNGEASETFTVQLTRSSAPAGVEPQSATATATIRDNDLALLPIDAVTVTEGGQANIVLMLERALQEPVLIGYATAGSATPGEDYDYTFSVPVVGVDLPLPQGAIEVPAGLQQGMVTVSAVDDSLAEGDEQIIVTLTTVTTDGSAPAVLGQAMVTIEDNDKLSVSVTGPKTVAEGDTARFTRAGRRRRKHRPCERELLARRHREGSGRLHGSKPDDGLHSGRPADGHDRDSDQGRQGAGAGRDAGGDPHRGDYHGR